jgi:hypothetical protein
MAPFTGVVSIGYPIFSFSRPAAVPLAALQHEYAARLDSLPESLEGSRTAEKLQAITELDLDELQTIEPPRGYGRD